MKLKGFLLFNGAIPTRVDVDALLEGIGIPQVGTHIPYADISAIIKLDRKNSRWNSVITAWRKELESEHNIFLKAIPNEGFDVMSDDVKMEAVRGHVKRSRNSLKRAEIIATQVKRESLTDENKASYDHYRKLRAALELVERTAAKDIVYPELDRTVGNGSNGAGN